MVYNSKVNSQVEILSKVERQFHDLLPGDKNLKPNSISIFQMNVGKKCNQACRHCHVDASPIRTETMSSEVMEMCLKVIETTPEIEVVDITGGAPEMNPVFREIVIRSRAMGKRVIDRCNLTILELPGYEYLYNFLRENQVEIVASLPHFSAASTDKQRGMGVFSTSIKALQKLNAIGYGSELPLNLVYNPNGFFLTSPQIQLEREFKEKLMQNFGVFFTNLYCINNMPISRFLDSLMQREKFQDYMDTLTNAFNVTTLKGLMCRSQISVGYDGSLYDCDFNQMLEMKLNSPLDHISRFNKDVFLNRSIKVNSHCFGCTAGAGSSCTGQMT